MKREKKKSWRKAILIELLASLAAGIVTALTAVLGGTLSTVLAYALGIVSGLLLSYRAVRRGLNNYAAWFLPAVMTALTHFLIWTYAPEMGPVLLCALAGVIGAAAGQVREEESNR